MADTNQELFDSFVIHAINVLRVDADLRNKVFALLDELQAEIVGTLANQVELTSFRKDRLEYLLQQVQYMISLKTKDIEQLTADAMNQLVAQVLSATRRSLSGAIGVDIGQINLSVGELAELAKDTLIQGAPSAEWWEAQNEAFQARFAQEVRMGILQGETNEQIARRIRGSASAGYRDGLVPLAKRHAETLVRTSVQAVANATHLAAFEKSEVVKGIRWVSVLDSRTTPICRALDGKEWDENGKPLGHNMAFPGPTAHWNCRSTQVPVLKSFTDMAGSNANPELLNRLEQMGDIFDGSTRAANGSSGKGQVPADLTYEQWLKQQSTDFQKEVLGPRRWRMWSRGGLSFTDMVDQSGRPIPVDQLAEKIAQMRASK